MANFKNKRVVITPDGIKLRPDIESLDYVDITLDSNNDIKIIDVSRNESLFDHFNEINVYGAGAKTVRRNRESINKHGKKTLEEVDETLRTQQEVNERASALLKMHNEDNYRVTVKCAGTGLELIKAGDIITLDFPEHRITKSEYLILEIRHSMYGGMVIELGKYNKGLSERFAEIIQMQKKTSAFARPNKFKTQTDTIDFFEKFGIKELRLIIRKTSKTNSPFTIGFNNAIDVDAVGERTLTTNTFTDSTCDWLLNVTTINHDANTNIVAGLSVSGTGIPVDATIHSILSTTAFRLSSIPSGTATNRTLTFWTAYTETNVGAPIGFNTSLGTVDTTTELDEELI